MRRFGAVASKIKVHTWHNYRPKNGVYRLLGLRWLRFSRNVTVPHRKSLGLN